MFLFHLVSLTWQELINNTDDSLPEHQRLKEAADKVGETVDYVNAMQRQYEPRSTQCLRIESDSQG